MRISFLLSFVLLQHVSGRQGQGLVSGGSNGKRRKGSESFSFTKGGNIRLGECNFHEDLFSSPDVSDWGACEDATTYTWRNDFDQDLSEFSSFDVERLAVSAGYCPHRRCQLGNVSASDEEGKCPIGLCFTKLENGRPSYGTCCFSDGRFESHSLLGYYNLSQPSPKPIYKKNRIVLGGDQNDTSYGSFINANEIYPGLIASQCPLTSFPNGFSDTTNSMKRLLIERNVSLWIQLSPSSISGEPMKRQKGVKSYCEVFPLNQDLILEEPGPTSQGVYNFSSVHNKADGYFDIQYTLQAFVTRNAYGQVEEFVFNAGTIEEGHIVEGQEEYMSRCQSDSILEAYCLKNSSCKRWEVMTTHIRHIWFYRWKDFATPSAKDFSALNYVADTTVSALLQKQSIVVSCYSGRGRTGTFAFLVLAKIKARSISPFISNKYSCNHDESLDSPVFNATYLSALVDIIVNIRRIRDGLVETPSQLKFVLEILRYAMCTEH